MTKPTKPKLPVDEFDYERGGRAGAAMRALLEEQKRLRRKRIRKITGLVLAAILVVAYFAISTFVFNPLEGSAIGFQNLVPRNCDFFVRKVNLASDLPLPATIATPLREDAPLWTAFAEGHLGVPATTVQGAVEGWKEAVHGLEAAKLDVVRDLAGRELCVAGRFAERGGLTATQVGLYLRVSWRVRLALGLAKYAVFRNMLFADGGLEERPNGVFKVRQGSRDLYLWRSEDLLLVATDEAWIDEARQLVVDKGKGSFGQGATFTDDIQVLLKNRQGSRANTPSNVQFHCNIQRYRAAVGDKGAWPDPQSAIFEERALASLYRSSIAQEATGLVRFELEPRRRIVLDVAVRTDTNGLDDFGKSIHQDRATRKLTKKDVALAGELSPRSAFAIGAVALSGGDFARQWERLLTNEDRRAMDDVIRRTVKYQSVRAFADDVAIALGQRAIFILRENNYPREEKDPFGDGPDPAIALVFPQQSPDKVRQLKEFLLANSGNLGFEQTFNYYVDANKQYPLLEYYTPASRSTGEIAVMQVGGDEKGEVLITNQAKLAKNVFRTWLDPGTGVGDKRYSEDPLYKDLTAEWMEFKGNVLSHAYAFVNGPLLEKALRRYVPYWAAEGSLLDPETMRAERPALFAKILKEKYPQFSTHNVPPKERAEIDELVDAEWAARAEQARAGLSPQLTKKYRDAIAWIASVPGVLFSIDFDPKSTKLHLNLALE